MRSFVYYGGLNPGSLLITSGTGNFEVPAYAVNLRARLFGPGACGNGWSPGGQTGGSATQDTTFGSITARCASGFVGGTASGGDVNTNGLNGKLNTDASTPGAGAASPRTDIGGGVACTAPGGSGVVGNAGNAYGGGGSSAKSAIGEYGNGGGSGAFAEKVWALGDLSAGSSISYVVGALQTPGGTSYLGGLGGAGAILIEWDY